MRPDRWIWPSFNQSAHPKGRQASGDDGFPSPLHVFGIAKVVAVLRLTQPTLLPGSLAGPLALRSGAILPRFVGRMEQAYGQVLKAVAADRGFDSQLNQFGLNEEGIYNAVCPRSPRQLQHRNGSWKFKRLQRRRAQTEGRIGILKNVFLDQPLRSKGFEHRELTVTWTVLVHNLWVIARLPQADVAQARQRAA